MTEFTDEQMSQTVLDALFSDDRSIEKEAQQATNEYVRQRAREDGIMRQVLPPENIGKQDLDPQVGHEEPTKIFEKEPETPPAVTIPLGTTPTVMEIAGNRGLVTMQRLSTPLHRKDQDELLSYQSDIRQIITDNDLKELLEEEDVTSFTTIDQILGGQPNTDLSVAGGVPLWQTITSEESGWYLTPESWAKSMQIMPQASSRFSVNTVVINQVLAEELTRWNADQLSPTLLEEVRRDGVAFDTLNNKNLIVTIKRNVVADNEMYMFAEPNKLGKFYILHDVTMFSEAKRRQLEWNSQETLGITLQPLGCAKATLESTS